MAFVVANRVQQTATANTTDSFTLTGTVTGFRTFASLYANNDTLYYCATDATGQFEIGEGAFFTAGPTLNRDNVYDSSNNFNPVTFVGTVTVFVTYPAEAALLLDPLGNLNIAVTIPAGSVWNGNTIAVSKGGTGVTSSSGANSVVLRNASQNIAFNNFIPGLATITAAAGTTVLTIASARNQILVGSTTQTFQLPNATTLALGHSFLFVNNSSGNLTVTDNASTVIEVIPPGGVTQKGVLANGTSAGTWGAYSFIPAYVNWGTNTLNLATTVISGGTWQGGTIGTAYGGTGLTTFAAANNAIYSTSASALVAGTLPVLAGGTGVTTKTGTGSVVLSTNPTITGGATIQTTTQAINIGTTQSTGAITIGGSSATGAIIIGGSSGSQFIYMGQTATSNIQIGYEGDFEAPQSSTTTINGAVTLGGAIDGNVTIDGDLYCTRSANFNLLTASRAVFTDASKNLVSVATTGTGNVVLATSPTFTTSINGGATFGAFASSTALTIGHTGTGAASTTNISTAALTGAFAKAINIGTGGTTGSTTGVNINTSVGGTTTVRGAFLVGNATSSTTDGAIFATNNITAFAASDIKFKTNIQTITNAVEKVQLIGGKTFDWTDEYMQAMGGEDSYFMRKSDAGVIAQDVHKAIPELTRKRKDGSLAVDYPKLVALAFAAIAELKAEIDELKKDK